MVKEKKTRVFELPFSLHPAQETIDSSPARFKVVMAGRRFGKTQYSLFWLLKHAAVPKTVNWLIAPTYRQAKEISWRTLLQIVPRSVIKSINHTDLSIELVNQSIIALKGSDNQDTLRGMKLHACVIEESAFQRHTIWPDIIRPALADLQGEALFITTPKGRNWIWKLYEHGRAGLDPDWASFHFSILDNPYIKSEEVQKIKGEVSNSTWEQEFLANVLTNVGLVYDEFQEASIFDPSKSFLGFDQWPMVRGMDWGIDDPVGCVWIHVKPITGEVVVTNEYVKNNLSVPKQAQAIKQITGNRRSLPGHDVMDRSAFKDEGTSMTSIAKQFSKEGLVFVPSEKDFHVGLEVVKRFFGGNGKPWAYISRNCGQLINAIKEWEHDQHEPDVLAAFRYGITHIYKKRLTSIFAGSELVESNIEADNDSPISQSGQRRLRVQRHDLAWGLDSGAWDYEAGAFA